MKKGISLLAVLILCSCASSDNRVIRNNYVLEKHGTEIPVCVNHPVILIEKKKPCELTDTCEVNMCGLEIPDSGVYEVSDDVCDVLAPQVVPYVYCLNNLPKPVHLVIKKENDLTICYDRNNGVQLPIAYCLPDTNVNVDVDVSTYTSVSQYMQSNQLMKNNMFFF